MLNALKIAAAATTIATAALALSVPAQARFDAGLAQQSGSDLQPVHYYGYGYGYRGYGYGYRGGYGYYAPRYYGGYGYRNYYAPRYYRYY